MVATAVPEEMGDGEVDVCTACYTMWFDAGEWAAAPPTDVVESAKPKETRPPWSASWRRTWDVPMRHQSLMHHGPESAWQALPAMFGLPVETDSHPLRRMPLATWLTAGLISLVSIAVFQNLPALIAAGGMIPADWSRDFGLTLVMSWGAHLGGAAFGFVAWWWWQARQRRLRRPAPAG